MENKDEILREWDEVIQYFIGHDDNEPKTEFCNNVDKLINLKADVANGDEQSESNCNLQNVSQQRELLLAFHKSLQIYSFPCV